MSHINKIFKILPYKLQNLAISIFNTKLYYDRHRGKYSYYRQYYSRWDNACIEDINKEHLSRLREFLLYSKVNSPWYKKNIYLNEKNPIENLKKIPVLEKSDIINNLNQIKTIKEKDGFVSLTGGTTGASMKVVYTKDDMQERFAILDHFRSKYGYKLGEKTAWFSGKNLISDKDIERYICSHYDFINKIRFYSTYHINQKNFNIYWESLNKFKPNFIVGFPSSVYEICKIAESKGLTIDHKVKVFFPTAETVLPQHREVIGRVLGCKLVDQYASSEGAPFILECASENLHIHPLTGIFEVVDKNFQPSSEGELLVTSFTTKGTPLIRYRIGDSIKLASKNKTCSCDSQFPLVDRINGRSNAFIYSPDKGKVNLNHFTVFTRELIGLLGFQIIQENSVTIIVNLVVNDKFAEKSEDIILSSLNELLGNNMTIKIYYVKSLPREKSGKIQVIKSKLNLDSL